jgi:hypothetical protein
MVDVHVSVEIAASPTKPLVASKLSSSPTETVHPSEGLAMEKDFTSMEIVSDTVP